MLISSSIALSRSRLIVSNQINRTTTTFNNKLKSASTSTSNDSTNNELLFTLNSSSLSSISSPPRPPTLNLIQQQQQQQQHYYESINDFDQYYFDLNSNTNPTNSNHQILSISNLSNQSALINNNSGTFKAMQHPCCTCTLMNINSQKGYVCNTMQNLDHSSSPSHRNHLRNQSKFYFKSMIV